MSAADFTDAALVLLGHGTTRHPGSQAPVFQHAAQLRSRGGFADVREAFWKQEPRLAAVLASLSARRIFLVPLFISEGYFSERLIPQALGLGAPGRDGVRRVRRQGERTLFYCKPVGTHDAVTGLLLARALEVLAPFPSRRAPAFKETTLFVAGHGTARDPNSRRAIERQAQRIRAMDLYADAQAVFLDEEPRIRACWALAATRRLVVVPFFISDGLHVQQDLPVLLGETAAVVQRRLDQGRPAWRNPTERDGKLVWLSPSVGTQPDLATLILARVREAAALGASAK